jgi:hypothetical protein
MSDRDEPCNEQDQDRETVEPSASPIARWSFILTLWIEVAGTDPGNPCWRGSIETPSRERTYFRSMTKLNDYLVATTGWQEPPA